MANVQFPGIKENLTAPGTPWIYYGVSILLPYQACTLNSQTTLFSGLIRRCTRRSHAGALSRFGLWRDRF